MLKTQVLIIGGGPAGMLLSHMLHCRGIESVVLERQTKDHVLSRIRAGVLEHGTVELLKAEGLGERLSAEGKVHQGIVITWGCKQRILIDTIKTTGKKTVAYGQTNLTEDIYTQRERDNALLYFEVNNVRPRDLKTNTPKVLFNHRGNEEVIHCDFVAGCDGYHGVSRQCIPQDMRREFERSYPFGWLGILSETPPMGEIIYAQSPRGFALCSMRNPMLSRYYVQCPIDDDIADWSDDRFWAEIKSRYPEEIANAIVTGPSIEKSIAPLRGFICEPMSWGNLFLAGDAAHIVPPTGAKGLNLAISDVYYLNRAIEQFYNNNNKNLLASYSATALDRVWKTSRFSWWATSLLHRFPDQSDFDLRLQEIELEHIASSEYAQSAFSDQYAGLAY